MRIASCGLVTPLPLMVITRKAAPGGWSGTLTCCPGGLGCQDYRGMGTGATHAGQHARERASGRDPGRAGVRARRRRAGTAKAQGTPGLVKIWRRSRVFGLVWGLVAGIDAWYLSGAAPKGRLRAGVMTEYSGAGLGSCSGSGSESGTGS